MTDDSRSESERRAASESLGNLFGEVSRDLSTLMRQELELAKAELTQSATRAGKGVGMFGGAAIAAIMTLVFLSVTLWWALGYLVGNAWSALIVAVIWAIIALILAMTGKKEIDQIRGMPKTVDSVKKIPEALKRNEENQ
ncbi:MAG: hypothetical protein JWM23_925 [Microbacteriaceae bacterium]|jgi:hypothetical protein|nr:hypothetical protein [Microbacteriaceae bacterium]